MANEIKEVEFSEAVEITSKNKTKLVWLGNENAEEIAALLNVDPGKVVRLMPTEVMNSNPESLSYLAKHVLVCYHGNTSKIVAQVLKSRFNIETFSLRGGITKAIGEI
ncbi:MAG: hypothetical protein M1331_01310 [Candidatus Marsarchaeota archaeon]|nr:hypothetical protein [Candidatus Marsarchaeota archaeon]MCL5106020.1 hypothetical protein [Candidatus Marsarchaeota archaeon]